MKTYGFEFPNASGDFPEVWGDRDKARERFLELWEEYGDKEHELYDNWDESDYMSFDDEQGGMYCIDKTGLNIQEAVNMWEHSTAYRFANGEVMGFRGIGFTKGTAQRQAEHKLIHKLVEIGEGYDSSREITTRAQVSTDEMKQIQEDWRGA